MVGVRIGEVPVEQEVAGALLLDLWSWHTVPSLNPGAEFCKSGDLTFVLVLRERRFDVSEERKHLFR